MEPLRILHCANFSETKFAQTFYAIDRKISNGLIRNGHLVYDFSYRDIARYSSLLRNKKNGAKKMNKALIETVRNLKPHLLLLGHSELVEESTLKRIKTEYPSIKIAMWWVDLVDEKRIAHIKTRFALLDALFTTTDVRYVRKFLGGNGSIYYMPNICDDSVESQCAFEKTDFKYDMLFIGRSDAQRDRFISKLTSMKDIRTGIFGTTKETLLFGCDYINTIVSAKMALNYNRDNDIPLYSSDRIVQLCALGTLVFSPRIPRFDSVFSSDEIVYFDDEADFFEKVRYYHLHDEDRIEIARRAWQKAHKLYEAKEVTKKMLQTILLKERVKNEGR